MCTGPTQICLSMRYHQPLGIMLCVSEHKGIHISIYMTHTQTYASTYTFFFAGHVITALIEISRSKADSHATGVMAQPHENY